MPDFEDAFNPLGWRRAEGPDGVEAAGVWARVLRQPQGGDSFALLRFEPGAAYAIDTDLRPKQLLVVEGSLEDTDLGRGKTAAKETAHKGAFIQYLPEAQHAVMSPGGCLALLISSPSVIGRPSNPEEAVRPMPMIRDSFGPEGWETSPNVAPGSEGNIRGVWSKTLKSEGKNRTVTLVYFEPGAIYPLHPHDHPQQILMLEGDAVDEIIDGEDHRRVATYRKGGFVDYPPIMSHSTHSPGGCLMVLGI